MKELTLKKFVTFLQRSISISVHLSCKTRYHNLLQYFQIKLLVFFSVALNHYFYLSLNFEEQKQQMHFTSNNSLCNVIDKERKRKMKTLIQRQYFTATPLLTYLQISCSQNNMAAGIDKSQNNTPFVFF